MKVDIGDRYGRSPDQAFGAPGEKRLHGYTVDVVWDPELLLRRFYTHFSEISLSERGR